MNGITISLIFLVGISMVLPTSAIMYASGQSTDNNATHQLAVEQLLLQLQITVALQLAGQLITVAHQLLVVELYLHLRVTPTLWLLHLRQVTILEMHNSRVAILEIYELAPVHITKTSHATTPNQ